MWLRVKNSAFGKKRGPFSVENYETFRKMILLAKYATKLTTKLTFKYFF